MNANPAAPRLIESWFPLNQLSTEAVRERNAASALPPINWLHVWWARRPLAPSRAAALLSLLPQAADADPATRPTVFDLLGTSPDIHHIARRLAAAAENGQRDPDGYAGHPRAFNHTPTAPQLDWLRQRMPHPDPLLLDVTAGGGSIPFEAGRLGLRAIANELNPVAALILRATCQWPQQHGYQLLSHYRQTAARFQTRVNQLLTGVYPPDPAPDCAAGHCPHPQRYRCAQNCQNPHDAACLHNKYGQKNHALVRAKRYAQTYLFARTSLCPACHHEIPLSPNWRLDNKGTGMRLVPGANRIDINIVHDRTICPDCRAQNEAKNAGVAPANDCHLAQLYPNAPLSPGTVNRAIAACPHCGSATPKGYLAQQAQAGQMGHRLYCVIYRDSWREKNKDGSERKKETTCRVFAEPQPYHFASNDDAIPHLAQREAQWAADDILPSEPLPDGNKTKDALYYGMNNWRNMFNPRQQLAHGYCVQAFRELVDQDADSGKLDDVRKAAHCYIALALDKLINRNSLQTRWMDKTNVVVGTFDSHDFGFKWSYAEMAVTIKGLGLEWAIDDIGDCIKELVKMCNHPSPENDSANESMLPSHNNGAKTARPAEITTGDARDLELNDASVDCIVFDPPYEENVCYAELSDFFYVWLKRTAGHVFPEHFTAYLTEKDQEAIASPARFRNKGGKGGAVKALALADYRQKMAEIFAECRRVIKSDGIMTVMFNHKSTAAWDALTVALIESGFAVTRTWPVKTEAEASLHIKGKAAARTTILLICRPRQANPFPQPWHEVEQLIAAAVRDDIDDNLSRAELRPIDLYLSAFGPALRVISRHWGTEREVNNPDRPQYPNLVTPTDALQVARREVSRHRAQEISREWASHPADPSSKFYILAKDASENDTLLFDEANLLARAIGVALEKGDAAMRRLAAFKGDKVTLLTARDRLAARSIGEDQNPGALLDTIHTAVALTDRRNTIAAREWLQHYRHDPQAPPFRATLEALIRTTKPGHDDYQSQRNLWQALYQTDPPKPTESQGKFNI